jgi:hypothetical protein
VAFASDPSSALVVSGDDGTMRHHLLHGALLRERRVPAGSYNVAFRWGMGVTPSLTTGFVTSLSSNGRVLGRRDIGLAAHDACIVFGP